jgi:hypothetical protein
LDDTLVFGPGGRNFLSSPRQYDAITLSTPFFYNPGAGNLLLDVRMYSPIIYPPGGQGYLMDGESTVGDSVSCVYALNVNTGTGTTLTAGLMSEFIVTPVPEPSTFALAGLGTLIVFSVVTIRRRNLKQKGKAWHLR